MMTPTMPEFTVATALSQLWLKAARELHPHELEWFASGAAHQVANEAERLSETLMGLGLLISNSDDISGEKLTEQSGLSHLMFSLSHQVSTLSGLAQIAADAGYRARLALKGDDHE